MKTEWKCVLDGGQTYEIVMKQNGELTWIMAKPLRSGYATGPHMVSCSGTFTVHYDSYHDQHGLGMKLYPHNFQIQSLVANQTPQYLSCSGTRRNFIVPAEPDITQISTSVISGTVSITTNHSGPIYYGNVY
ncbi:MAG TPA: hypothetical protein VE862_05035 [Candidatus Acidoferrum sp.]|nr:hypothetical protein [Candidatus Acidoferrum sp.]